MVPVVAVRSDVLVFDEDVEQPLFHVVSAATLPGSSRLFAYVRLFETFEFVVLLDENCEAPLLKAPTHILNLVTGLRESRSAEWVVTGNELSSWLTAATGHRVQDKSSSLVYWMKNRAGLWLKRAIAVGTAEYVRLQTSGVPEEQAQAAAAAKANKVLEPHGLSLANFKVSLADAPAKPL